MEWEAEKDCLDKLRKMEILSRMAWRNAALWRHRSWKVYESPLKIHLTGKTGSRESYHSKDSAGKFKDYTNLSSTKPNWKWKKCF